MHHTRRIVGQQRDGVLDGVPVRGGFRVRFPHGLLHQPCGLGKP